MAISEPQMLGCSTQPIIEEVVCDTPQLVLELRPVLPGNSASTLKRVENPLTWDQGFLRNSATRVKCGRIRCLDIRCERELAHLAVAPDAGELHHFLAARGKTMQVCLQIRKVFAVCPPMLARRPHHHSS